AGVVLDERLEAPDPGLARVLVGVGETEPGVGGDELLEVGVEAHQLGAEMVAAVAVAELDAEAFLVFGAIGQVGLRAGRGDPAVNTAEKRVAVVETIVRAESRREEILVARAVDTRAAAVVEGEPLVTDPRTERQDAGLELVLDVHRRGEGLVDAIVGHRTGLAGIQRETARAVAGVGGALLEGVDPVVVEALAHGEVVVEGTRREPEV